MNSASGLTAGFVLIFVVVACVVVGTFGLGELLGSRVIGGFIGGIAGVAAGFIAVYRMYLKPLRAESLGRDYSHLEPKVNDDD